MNFTHKTLEFLDWTVLRDVPNRGFDKQEDVSLRGILYNQRISDLANSADGLPNLPLTGSGKAPGIHFEQGLFMRTPALIPWKEFAPVEDFGGDFNKVPRIRGPQRIGRTISRMASIPRGTRINAQCLEPEKPVDGPPIFENLSIRTVAPFFLKPGTGQPLHEIYREAMADFFPQADFGTNEDINRLALQFKKSRDNNVINEQQFSSAENFLKDRNVKLGDSIISHITFKVDTQPKLEPLLWGGGSDNIAQLAEVEVVQVEDGVNVTNHKGDVKTTTNDARKIGRSSANANAVHVTC
jgi:hypothetical protein